MPKFIILSKTNLQEDSWNSMLISLLRGLAALQVAAAHLRAQMYPGFGTVEHPSALFKALAFGSGFAYLAVIVFFVLSGWLVGGSFLNKIDAPSAFQHYAIDRISRLWVVLVPTFLVVVLAGAATGAVDIAHASYSPSEPYSLGAFVGNLVGLQTIVVPPFGGDFPLWSLANETWYYVLFPLLVVVFRGQSMGPRVMSVLAVGAIVQLVHSSIMLYFSIWLLGVAFSRVKIEASAVLRRALTLLLVGSAVFIRLKGLNDITTASYPQYLLFSLVFVLFLSSMQLKLSSTPMLDWLDRVVRFFANFSFTLYVLHVPMIFVMAHLVSSRFGIGQLSPQKPSHFLIYAGMYLVSLVGAYAFYLPFEANTVWLRRWVKMRLITSSRTVRP